MERCQFFSLDQRKLVDKVYKVLEARVEMCFSREQHDVLEMRVVDVRIHSEQTFEDDFYDCFKVSWERNTKGTREYFFVVQLILDPRHQEVNVFACADLERRFHVVSISPQVLVLRPCRHRRTRLSRAELG